MSVGVSILVCTHNGAKRLPKTLAHLYAQRVPADIRWEVILVDNASTDDTATVARACWPPENAPAPLYVVSELRLGLLHARNRAVQEARYEILSFVDDDNWAHPGFVARVGEVFAGHPEVAVCGGPSEGAFEVSPPDWFSQYAYAYAVGPQAPVTGYVSLERGFLWGAGISVRRAAWQALLDNGISFLNTGRAGKRLSSGEDMELCLALLLAGWKLWYDESIRIQHYMTAPRLSWQYLRKMYRGFGASEVSQAFYRQALSALPGAAEIRFHRSWQRQALSWVLRFLQCRQNWRALLGVAAEGEFCVLELEKLRGRLVALWDWRQTYRHQFDEIERAAWRATASPQQLVP